jgi:hypothetical protein
VERMVDAKMTRFRAMSLDEQTMILEKSVQEARKGQRGNDSSRSSRRSLGSGQTTENPLVAPIQERYFPMAQDARRVGYSCLNMRRE